MSGIVLGAVDFRTRQNKCYDWSDLLTVAGRDGRDRKARGLDGMQVRPRSRSALSGRLLFRLDGRWDGNTPRSGGDAAWVTAMYASMDMFLGLVDSNTALPVTVHRDGATNLTGSLFVDDPGPASFPVPWRALYTVRFTVPSGVLS